MTAPLSLMTRSVLEQLEMLRKERDGRAIEQAFEYTGDAGVEPDDLESRGGPSSVLNPLEAGRSASSGLRR